MFGHPKGLMVLFFTEFWERFSFYGMKAVLVLYLVAQTQSGGFGWTESNALTLYGWYGLAVYFLGLPGGIIADRWWGRRKCVIVGGAFLCAGHLLMAANTVVTFFIAISLICIGVGLLKPNISTMVGDLYQHGDAKRDAGFTIFYMGINLGAMLAPIVVGLVAERIGWHYGFAIAGLGMIAGQCVFISGQKYLGEAGKFVKKTGEAMIKQPLTKVEWHRIALIFISFIIVIVFWGAFEQIGGFMNLYNSEYTNRTLLGWEVPASWFQSLNPFYIVTIGPFAAVLWVWLGRIKKDPSDISKMGMGIILLGLGFVLMVGASTERLTSVIGKSSLLWLVGANFLFSVGELFSSPISLSFITKFAPPRLVSTIMGSYWVVTGLGEKLAGEVGKLAVNFGDRQMFAYVSVVTIGLGLLLIVFVKLLNRLAHEDKSVG